MGKGRGRALDSLKEARRRSRANGNALVLTSSMDATKRTSRVFTSLWWNEDADPRGPRAEAGQGLALTQAEVRDRPDGRAAQGTLRARRLEDGPDSPAVLTAGRRGTAPKGPQGAPDRRPLSTNGGHKFGRHRPAKTRNFNGANGIRTRDLLLAKQALSQLSYGPAHAMLRRRKARKAETRLCPPQIAVPGSGTYRIVARSSPSGLTRSQANLASIPNSCHRPSSRRRPTYPRRTPDHREPSPASTCRQTEDATSRIDGTRSALNHDCGCKNR